MTQGPTPPGVPGGWVDIASRLVVQVGFPIVVAAVLLWFLLTRFQYNMDAITTRMANNTIVVAELIEHEKDAVAELRDQSAELTKQTALMAEISANAGRLVTIRSEEAATLKRIEEQRK